MSETDPLGRNIDIQKEAVQILEQQGPLTYSELENELEKKFHIDRNTMQSVIRGLQDNKWVGYDLEEGTRKYKAVKHVR